MGERLPIPGRGGEFTVIQRAGEREGALPARRRTRVDFFFPTDTEPGRSSSSVLRATRAGVGLARDRRGTRLVWMARSFNVAGPCIPGRHFLIPSERRLPEARSLVKQGLFFVLHAPRQSGKTTLLNTLARALNEEGRFTALVISVEHLRPVNDVSRGILSIVHGIHVDSQIRLSEAEHAPDPAPFAQEPLSALLDYLRAWSAACPKPTVLFIDEIDCLPADLLLSVLGQLRMGYAARPAPFLHSLALVGLRDVRDFRVKLRPDADSMGTSSPFNVKSDSLTLRNFTEDEVAELYLQHTADTGQVFEPGAIVEAYRCSEGQPWLVNALARQATEKEVPDRAQPITAAHIEASREVLILRRDTHLDSLVDKLHEERVRRVIEPILAGTTMTMDPFHDDLMYVRDLGLIVTRPNIRIANPIYKEAIPRSLTYIMQVNIVEEVAFYQRPDGGLHLPALLRAFQAFFAENSEAWLERFDYKEAGPHLVLMAFLQRVINGGGAIHREFAVASGRVDLLLEWKGEKYAIELKIRRGERTLFQGIEQLSRYLLRLGLEEGYLILFDRRPEVSWDDKLYERELPGASGRRIHLFGA